VLFTSSIAALMPRPFEAVYAASKAFVQSFAEALRNELKDAGVNGYGAAAGWSSACCRGLAVRVLTRNAARAGARPDARVEVAEGDVRDPASLVAPMVA
jgi:short subunit dehydrogenase